MSSVLSPRIAGGVPGGGGGGGASLSSRILWRWNELDASQIGTPVVLNGAPSSPTLSVQRGDYDAPSLRFTFIGSGGYDVYYFPLLDDDGNFLALPERYEFRHRFTTAIGPGGEPVGSIPEHAGMAHYVDMETDPANPRGMFLLANDTSSTAGDSGYFSPTDGYIVRSNIALARFDALGNQEATTEYIYRVSGNRTPAGTTVPGCSMRAESGVAADNVRRMTARQLLDPVFDPTTPGDWTAARCTGAGFVISAENKAGLINIFMLGGVALQDWMDIPEA